MRIIHFFLQISKYSKDFEECSGQWICLSLQIDEYTCHFWGCLVYRKNLKNLDIQKSYCKHNIILILLVMDPPQDADRMVNNVDPDQTLIRLQSELGLYCLPRPVRPKT